MTFRKRNLLAAVAIGCISTAALPQAAASAQDATQIERGVTVYADERCSLCHAVGGEGKERGPLDGVGTRLGADDIQRWIVAPKEMTEKAGATRRPPMRAYPDLAAEDLEALVAYMLSLKEP